MQVSGQLHAPATLHPGKETAEPNGGWVGSRAGLDTVVKRKNLSLPRIEPRSSMMTAIPAPECDEKTVEGAVALCLWKWGPILKVPLYRRDATLRTHVRTSYDLRRISFTLSA
jgi:hypothetical protein